jgi:hypothetical protein
MPEGLGGLLAEGLEAGAKKLGSKPAEGFLGDIEHVFSFNSEATGKSGAVLRDTVEKHLYPEQDRILAVKSQQAKQAGTIVNPRQLQSDSMHEAADNVYGKKRENLARIMYAVHQEHGPAKVSQLTDYMGIILHEQAYNPPGTGLAASKTSSALAKDPQLEDLGIKFKPSPYHAMTGTEQAVNRYTTATLAPYVALWHGLQAILNSGFNAHLSSMAKALGDVYSPKTFEATKQQLLSQNGLGHLMLQEQTELWNFKHGLTAKFTPNSIGEFIHKNYLLPGMSYVRSFNMVYSSAVGKYEAEHAAQAVIAGGKNRIYGANKLADLGINWKNVVQNGRLTQDETRVAMARMTQMNVFMESSGARARFTVTSPWGRTLTMFHQYATMEGNLITKKLADSLMRRHDPLQTAQILTTLGLAFPTAGFFINNVIKGMTGREDHPVDAFTEEEKNYLEGKDFGDALLMIGRMGAGGIWYDYTNAATRNKLAEAALGPVVNAGIELGTDALKANPLTEGGGEHKADQFKRDLLRDIPSYGYGARLAHELYPTQAQRNAAKPMTSRRIAAQRAARKRKQTYHP